jgi:hypothetical protein
MPLDDPNTWILLKTGFDTFRSAVGLVRDTEKALGRDETSNKVINAALDHAVGTAAIAEVEIAKGLGYELCKCQFPPTIMLTVGGITGPQGQPARPIYECPKCGYNSSGGWSYNRIAPKRSPR